MESVAVGERGIKYDARGLVEPDAEPPRTSEIADGRAVFDATGCTTRTINLEIRWLLNEKAVNDITVRNPGAKHSIGVAILERCKIRFEGSLGYFGVGLIDGPEIVITGRGSSAARRTQPPGAKRMTAATSTCALTDSTTIRCRPAGECIRSRSTSVTSPSSTTAS